MTTLFMKNKNDNSVIILNVPQARYDLELWENLKARLSMDDQQLANTLNNE